MVGLLSERCCSPRASRVGPAQCLSTGSTCATSFSRGGWLERVIEHGKLNQTSSRARRSDRPSVLREYARGDDHLRCRRDYLRREPRGASAVRNLVSTAGRVDTPACGSPQSPCTSQRVCREPSSVRDKGVRRSMCNREDYVGRANQRMYLLGSHAMGKHAVG